VLRSAERLGDCNDTAVTWARADKASRRQMDNKSESKNRVAGKGKRPAKGIGKATSKLASCLYKCPRNTCELVFDLCRQNTMIPVLTQFEKGCFALLIEDNLYVG